jgi:hypothetical protein
MPSSLPIGLTLLRDLEGQRNILASFIMVLSNILMMKAKALPRNPGNAQGDPCPVGDTS